MNITKQFLINLIISFWLILISVFSIQNIQPISLKFFIFESISIPSGVLLSMIIALGFMLGAFIPIFFGNNNQQKKRKNIDNNRKKRTEFKRDWQEENDPLFDWE